MKKIFKVRMKFLLWHSGPLKFAGVGKVFVKGPLFTFFENRKFALKLIFCAESIVGSPINMEKYLKFE